MRLLTDDMLFSQKPHHSGVPTLLDAVVIMFEEKDRNK